MPSQAALERGSAVAQGIIDSHMQGAAGAYPETVAVRPRLPLCPASMCMQQTQSMASGCRLACGHHKQSLSRSGCQACRGGQLYAG